jgi:hypothetical protein
MNGRFAQIAVIRRWGELQSRGPASGKHSCVRADLLERVGPRRYLTHPQHVEFADWIKPFLASATVVDYWTDGASAP